jgi:hypothetical protein
MSDAEANDAAPEARDDETIPNDMLLYRKVSRYEIIRDHNLGRYRPSSNLFQKTKGTDRMSVVLDDALRADGRSPLDLIDERVTAGSFTAGFVRNECKEGVVRKPEADEPAHGNVVGTRKGSAEEKRKRDRLAREAACVEGDWEAARRER